MNYIKTSNTTDSTSTQKTTKITTVTTTTHTTSTTETATTQNTAIMPTYSAQNTPAIISYPLLKKNKRRINIRAIIR